MKQVTLNLTVNLFTEGDVEQISTNEDLKRLIGTIDGLDIADCVDYTVEEVYSEDYS